MDAGTKVQPHQHLLKIQQNQVMIHQIFIIKSNGRRWMLIKMVQLVRKK